MGLSSPAGLLPVTGATIEWVVVGDAGNTAAPSGYGAVSSEYWIMRFEWSNQQYVDYLNAIDPDGTNPNGVYSTSMGSQPRGGILFASGASAGSKYSVRPNMGNKPVNYVSWFDAARVANWLHNGGQAYPSSDASVTAPQNTGAYSLGTAVSGSAPARNVDARFSIPTENQWFKAAYYKGGGADSGYWSYATGSDTLPTGVSATANGDGAAGFPGIGNFANFGNQADWNSLNGNVTTLGSNGGPSAYGTFDMTGNVGEWNDLTGGASQNRGRRGGAWDTLSGLSSATRSGSVATNTSANDFGFRLVAANEPAAAAVPEPSGIVLFVGGMALLAAAFRKRAFGEHCSTSVLLVRSPTAANRGGEGACRGLADLDRNFKEGREPL